VKEIDYRGLEVPTWMRVYKVFYIHKNDVPMTGEFIGGLIERRKDLRGKSRVESGLEWARLIFGHMVKDTCSIFVVPDDLYLKSEILLPIGKKIYDREEFLWMIEAVDLSVRRKREKDHPSPRFMN
jgi:hypothetical protein